MTIQNLDLSRAAAVAVCSISLVMFLPGARVSAQTPGAGAQHGIEAPNALREAPTLPYHKTIKKLPSSPQERRKVLANLYAFLATAPDKKTAKEIASTIESLWYHSGSDTISVLLNRAHTAMVRKDLETAVELLDAVVALAPDFAEGWNRRALIHYMQNDYARALGDLRRAIALEPNHFRALDGLGRMLRDVGQKRSALNAFRLLKRVHPFWENADEAIKELEEEVEGRGI